MPLSAAQIQVTVGADYAPLTALNSELNVTATAAGKTAASFVYMGEAAAKAEASVAPLGAANERMAASTNRASAQLGGFASNMGAARVEMGALEGSTGMMASGLARVAAQSSSLGPLIQSAFAPVAAIAFLAILVDVGKKIYDVYENVVLLKGSIEELDKAEAAEAERAASLNDEYEESLARRLEQQGDLTDAAAAFRKAESDRPLELPKIDDKIFEQFSSDFVSFMQSVHTTSDAPTVLSRIRDEAVSTQTQIGDAKQTLQEMQDVAQAQGADVSGSPQAKLVEDLTAKLGVLRGMYGEVQSQIGITNQRLADFMDGLADKAAEAAKKEEQQQRELGQAKLDAAEITAKGDANLDEKLALASASAIQDKVAALRAETKAKQEDARQDSAATVTKMRGEENLPGETLAQTTVLDAQIESEKERLQGELVSLSVEGAQREAQLTAEAIRQGNEQKMRLWDQAVEAAEQAANRELAAADKAAVTKGRGKGADGGASGDDAKTAALNDWYAKQTRILVLAESFAEQTYGKDGSEYQALIRKKEALDQEYTLRAKQNLTDLSALYAQVMNRMEEQADVQITKAIMGQETWGEAGRRIYTQAAETFVQNSLKMMEQEVVQFAVSRTLTGRGIEADAAKAASGAYAATTEIPFVGPELAPIAAAAAFTAVMAFGSFDRGGIVDGTTLGLLHDNEMVLDPPVSMAVQGSMAAMRKFTDTVDGDGSASTRGAGAGAGAGGGDTHNHFNVTAADARSVTEMLHRNRSQLGKIAGGMYRNGFRIR